jgi:glycosyltransferase involved in cell wall biosynthesis
VRRGKVFLAAETAAMRSELESFTHLPVHHFPHPVPTPSQPWGAPTEPNPFVLVCPGFARHEKGSDLLLEAMPRLLSGPWSQRVRFVLQWPEPFRLPDGSWCTPSEALRRDRRVEFIDRPLDEVAYQNLLGRTHALLLPYRLNSYHNRISRVALEGAARGIPLVFTQGTSPQELHLPADAYVTCRDNDSGSLADSIESLLARWPSAERVARRSASAIADLHSANRFRRQLQALDEVPS